METISSLLARAMGSKGGSEKKTPTNFDGLPDSLRELVKSINANTSGRDKVSKDEKTTAAKRQNQIDELQRQFNSNIQELVDVTAILNDTQLSSLEQAEKRAKRDEERHKRDEAARKRAEKLSAVTTRQNAAKNEIGVGLLGALFGKGIGDFAANVLKAREQTQTDISELSEALYEDKIAAAADQKAAKMEGAEIEKDEAIAKATASYKEKMGEQAASLGGAVQEAKESDAVLARTEAAQESLEAAKALRDKIEAEGSARLAETSAGTRIAAPSEGAVVGAPAVKENAAAPATPIIVTPSGEDAVAAVQAERTRNEVASRNLEADATVSRANDEFAKARREEGTAPAAYSGATIQGETAIAEIGKAREETAAAIKDATINERNSKAEAVDSERLAKNAADAEKASGALVPEDSRKSIGMTNLVTGAVAPPALVIIGKVMEKFQNMFPVIEQTGNALIELGTALPATLFVVGGQLIAGIQAFGASLIDAIWTPDVRKRYDESNAVVMEATGGKGRADLFREAQERNLDAYQASASRTPPAEMRSGMGEASRGPVRANAPQEFTYAETPSTATGIAHMERAGSGTREASARQSQEQPVPERALGVIPVGPSNGNIDSWR